MAKQSSWRDRAQAFDAAAKTDPGLIKVFNNLLYEFFDQSMKDPVTVARLNGELEKLDVTIRSGGYQAPPDEEDWDDSPKAKAN